MPSGLYPRKKIKTNCAYCKKQLILRPSAFNRSNLNFCNKKHFYLYLKKNPTLTCSPKRNKKISLSRKGMKFTKEHKKNLSKSLTGRKLSKEHIENARKGHIKYHTKEEKRKARAKTYKKWRKNNPEKHKAHIIAMNNIKIPKDKLCEICNSKKATQKHHKNYSKPLDVNFLCLKCHQKLHHHKI